MELLLGEQFHFLLFELENFKKRLFELKRLLEHLIGELLSARTMT